MWKLRTLVIGLCVIGLMITGCSKDTTSDGRKLYKIGVLQVAEHPALDAANRGVVDGLKAKGFSDNIVWDQQNAQGDQSNMNSIGQRFVATPADAIVAIATPAAQAMANATKDIPIVATAITSFETARLVDSDAHPGGNVTGATDMVPMDKKVKLIKQLMPGAKRIGTIYSSSEVNSQLQADLFKEEAAKYGMELVEVTVSSVNDVPQAAADLSSKGIDAVFFPTDNIVASSYATLVNLLSAYPIFPSDDTLMKDGGIASYSCDFYKLGVQTGEMLARILSGEVKPDALPVEPARDINLVINRKEAERLGITIPKELDEEAKEVTQ